MFAAVAAYGGQGRADIGALFTNAVARNALGGKVLVEDGFAQLRVAAFEGCGMLGGILGELRKNLGEFKKDRGVLGGFPGKRVQ